MKEKKEKKCEKEKGERRKKRKRQEDKDEEDGEQRIATKQEIERGSEGKGKREGGGVMMTLGSSLSLNSVGD